MRFYMKMTRFLFIMIFLFLKTSCIHCTGSNHKLDENHSTNNSNTNSDKAEDFEFTAQMVIDADLAFMKGVNNGFSAEEVGDMVKDVILVNGGSKRQAAGAKDAVVAAIDRATAKGSSKAAVKPDWKSVSVDIAKGALGNSETADKDGDGDVDIDDERIKRAQQGKEKEQQEIENSSVIDGELKALIILTIVLAWVPIACGICCSYVSRNYREFKYNCMIGNGLGCECCGCCFSDEVRQQTEDAFDTDPVQFLTALNESRTGGTTHTRRTRLVELKNLTASQTCIGQEQTTAPDQDRPGYSKYFGRNKRGRGFVGSRQTCSVSENVNSVSVVAMDAQTIADVVPVSTPMDRPSHGASDGKNVQAKMLARRASMRDIEYE